ncbi:MULTISPECIES: alpha/beta fold hydrolase [unclassified Streptomyces]|uniref:alpha/beta fold hydrolase n=1 Tax=unclassified Streptomyces TaxID=2593676 RepID=UPI002250F8B9|nr:MULTISPECIES: alpha/beta hydrolase [unclassified Streptomyces]MCX4525591.1 alpha/beta hydrolase [Streptomyces sp. NBC_01551]MCX4543937.1 alpha/beta hydrolase [Streptomyces sp. NBC_01565]
MSGRGGSRPGGTRPGEVRPGEARPDGTRPGRFVRVGGVPVHVVVEGAGPPVVLSAGLAMAWFDWDPVAALLAARGRTVVRFDRPGHGLSGPAPGPPSAAGEARAIAGLLDALGLPGPVTVVGHSIAGFHAEAFARLYPARTAALVLVDSSVEEAPRTVLPAALRTGAARALGRAVSAAGLPAALGPSARRAAVRASRTGGAGDPAAPDLVRRCYRTGRVWRGALLENSRYLDMAAEVVALRRGHRHRLSAPATVLAAYDGSARPRALRWLARQADLADRIGARFEVAEPAGHLVMLDRPDQVARAVLAAAGAGQARA